MKKTNRESGNLEVIGGDSKSRYIHVIKPDGDTGKHIATAYGTDLANCKVNAEQIVKYWNEYDGLKAENEALKEANKELLEALISLAAELKCYDWSKETYPVFENAKTIINKHSKQ
jgi:hypothetical protein